MKGMYFKACTRLHSRLTNRKGMEMLQVVLIVVLAIGLTAIMYTAIKGWIEGGAVLKILNKIENANG